MTKKSKLKTKKKINKSKKVNTLYKKFLKIYAKSTKKNKDNIFSRWTKQMSAIDKKYNDTKYDSNKIANDKILNERIKLIEKYIKLLNK